LELNVLLWKTGGYEERSNPISLVSLENYLTVFRCPTTGAKCFELLREASKILVFLIYAFYDCRWLSEFPSLTANLDALLLFADFCAYTDVRW
jgi:hypothetical protein